MAVDKKSVIQNVVTGLLVAVGVYAIFMVMASLSNSWLKIFLIAVAVASGLFLLVTKGKNKKVTTVLVASILIFAISFASVESYMFANAGYPSTYTTSEAKVTLSLQGLLNTSLTELVQKIEQSTAFSLLKLEYGDKIALRFLEFETAAGDSGAYPGGYIQATFSSENSANIFYFSSRDGNQYTVRISQGTWPQSTSEITNEALNSIDSLEISWFYNQALEIAQNRTNSPYTIEYLSLSIQDSGYPHGINLLFICHDINYQKIIADFNMNGTLNYMSQPPK